MKRLYIFLLIPLLLNSCILLKKHNSITSGLQDQIKSKQGQLDDLTKQLESSRSKLNQLGELEVATATSGSDEERATSYRDDGSWIPLKNPERYKNYLTGGLGIIWLEKADGTPVEGGYLPFDRYNAEPEIPDPGDVIFRYFVNNKFSTKVSVVSAVTASMNTEDYGKLTYEILGTSRLKIPQDSLESIALKYAKGRYSDEVKAVYLATGFHIRKISLQTYSKMAANAVATVPVAAINGELYHEAEAELYNWYVEVRLLDLRLFIPSKVLESQKVLAKNQTPFQLLKLMAGEEITDEAVVEMANNPEVLTGGNVEGLKELLGRREIRKAEVKKINSVGEELLKSKTKLLNERQE